MMTPTSEGVLMKVFGLAILIPVCAVSYLCKEGDGAVAIIARMVFTSSTMALYFFPAICSIRTKSKARASTFKLNFLAGWTGLGWILAFYMAKVLPLDDDKI
ncbi:hypothetical protein CRN80_00650 [Pseudomonas sp. FDAARGOS_380]|uniref:superinfection immunity protein n=1 Tax=unclassified Pseudomonas TaxID=196821 RepID=UPI000BFDC05A|nr:superinfection immunity protein [Pseudomonas sp. FDAARGOS_380]ATN08263.1 hypothetical protein CRN80_00650 [Pseudomonas sp. FDAARGOS_380]